MFHQVHISNAGGWPNRMAIQPQQYLVVVAILFLTLIAAARVSDGHDDGVRPVPRDKSGQLKLQRYKTEPDFQAVAFDIIRRPTDSSLLAPGLLFMTIAAESGHASEGAQIYDTDGNLVWHSGQHHAQNLNMCDYLGHNGDHLSLHGQGHNIHILDQKYKVVSKNVSGPNGHESNVLPGGRSLLRIRAVKTPIDTSPYLKFRNGWAKDNCFEEINIKTGKLIFSWCYLDWLPVWETTIYPPENSARARTVNATMRSEKAGYGTRDEPWDFIHGNAIDKFDGDYLISCRHLDQIIKIAGPDNPHGVKPGTVLWRLGGPRSDFTQDFSFSRQHHVRFVSVTANETVISFFNNAWEGELAPSSQASDGKVVRINNITMTAEVVTSCPHPGGSLSEGRGSTQLLPNGNILVGYGRFPDISEHLQDGTAIYHARYSSYKPNRNPNINISDMDWSYRVYKHSSWVGHPPDPPKLLVYSLDCNTSVNSPLIAYVSWNGATEVVSWRFFVSARAKKKDNPWVHVGTFPKTGFETQVHLSSFLEAKILKFTPYVWVQGLDASGEVLRNAYAHTWVPNNAVRKYCDASGCSKRSQPFWYNAEDSRSCQHGRDISPFVALALVVAFIESMVYLGQQIVSINLLKSLCFGAGEAKKDRGESNSAEANDPLISSEQPVGE